MKKLFISAFWLVVLGSCKKDHHDPPQTLFKGIPATIGNGSAWSWVEKGSDGHLEAIGITFNKNAFTNLPDDDHTGHSHEYEYKLPLPAEKSSTIFDHVIVNWNPKGHPPDLIYDKPHFDLHFYMMAEADRLQIPAFDVDSTGFKNYPAPDYLPAAYFPIPGGEAKMGVHWADATSPELDLTNPKPFTQTFIYGSYNGKVTYYEPMATLAFLKSTKLFSRNIPQPARFDKDGYYPTRLSFTEKGETMEIALHHFVYHKKS